MDEESNEEYSEISWLDSDSLDDLLCHATPPTKRKAPLVTRKVEIMWEEPLSSLITPKVEAERKIAAVSCALENMIGAKENMGRKTRVEYTPLATRMDKIDTLQDLPTSSTRVSDYVNNLRLMLIYSRVINRRNYTTWMTNLSTARKTTIKTLLFVRVDETTHVLVHWEKKIKSNNKSIFDYKGEHPLLRYITTPDQFKRANVFMYKGDRDMVPVFLPWLDSGSEDDDR